MAGDPTLEIKPDGVNWFGLDVYKFDGEGRESIVTEIGSVHDMPYENSSMDFILANQSLEHWFEYVFQCQRV